MDRIPQMKYSKAFRGTLWTPIRGEFPEITKNYVKNFDNISKEVPKMNRLNCGRYWMKGCLSNILSHVRKICKITWNSSAFLRIIRYIFFLIVITVRYFFFVILCKSCLYRITWQCHFYYNHSRFVDNKR